MTGDACFLFPSRFFPPSMTRGRGRRNRTWLDRNPRMAYWLRRSDYHPVANPAPGAPVDPPNPAPPTNPPNPVPAISQPNPMPPALPEPTISNPPLHPPEPTTIDPPPPPYSGDNANASEPQGSSATTANTLPSGLSSLSIHHWLSVRLTFASDDDLITVSIPLDSDVVAQPPLRTEFVLSASLGFNQFYSLICDTMTIPPSRANLGYRFSWEPIRADHRRFGTEDDYRAVVAQMLKKKRAARSVTPVLWVYNEVRFMCATIHASTDNFSIRMHPPRRPQQGLLRQLPQQLLRQAGVVLSLLRLLVGQSHKPTNTRNWNVGSIVRYIQRGWAVASMVQRVNMLRLTPVSYRSGPS